MADDIVERTLLNLGCDPTYAGFKITTTAVHMICNDPTLEDKMTNLTVTRIA